MLIVNVCCVLANEYNQPILVRIQTRVRVLVLRLRCSRHNWHDFSGHLSQEEMTSYSWGFASAPKQLKTVEMKIRTDIISKLALRVASGCWQKPPIPLSPITCLELNFKGVSWSRNHSSFPHGHPEIRSNFHSSPLFPFWFQGAGGWRESSVDSSWVISPGALPFNVFTIPHMPCRGNRSSFLEDQSVREIEVLLFPLLISSSIFMKPFRGSQYLQLSFLQRERFRESSHFPAFTGH